MFVRPVLAWGEQLFCVLKFSPFADSDVSLSLRLAIISLNYSSHMTWQSGPCISQGEGSPPICSMLGRCQGPLTALGQSEADAPHGTTKNVKNATVNMNDINEGTCVPGSLPQREIYKFTRCYTYVNCGRHVTRTCQSELLTVIGDTLKFLKNRMVTK